MGSDDEKVTVRIPKRFLRAIDFLVDLDDFPSRSEAVRAAIRDLIYARIDLVHDRIRKMQSAETAISEKDALKKQFLQK